MYPPLGGGFGGCIPRPLVKLKTTMYKYNYNYNYTITIMDDLSILTFYQLCSDCNLPGLIESFGDLSDTTNIEMNFAYYMVITSDVERRGVGEPKGSPPLLQWLLKLDPTIHHDTIVYDYMADERFPNDALHLACVAGHYNVAKWLFQQFPYLSSFKNRVIHPPGGYIPHTPSSKREQFESLFREVRLGWKRGIHPPTPSCSTKGEQDEPH